MKTSSNTIEIKTLADIQLLVDTFYQKVRENDLIGPVFNSVIKDKWPEHLDKMYRFWQTVLLQDHQYNGSPFPPHAKLPITTEHFSEWLRLWTKTLDEKFSGAIAEEAKWRAEKMAVMFLSKLNYYQNNSATPLM